MKKFDSMWLGTILGVLMTFVSIFAFYLIRFADLTIHDYFKLLIENRFLFAPIVSISGVPNLVVFFLFLNKEKYKTARGVILATFIIVVAVLIIKYWK